MYKLVCSLLLVCCLGMACNNANSKNNNANKTSTSIKGNWYKRYTGTIAGLPVVVNLYCTVAADSAEGLAMAGGNYYYSNKSEIIDLSLTISHDSIIATEAIPTERDDAQMDDVNKKPNSWAMVVDGTTAKGKWTSSDGKKVYDIDLKEDYTDAYTFDMVQYEDSAAFNGKHIHARGMSSFIVAEPSHDMKQEDAAFINNALMKELGGDTMGKNMNDFMKMSGKIFLDEYKDNIGGMDDDTGVAAYGEMNNWDQSMNMVPVYNDHGIVELEMAWYEYSGGAHGNYGVSHICLDMQRKKVWKLGDIMNVDSMKISKLLEAEARKEFKMKPTDTLSYTLLVDTIPVTDNIVVSDRGIMFYYNPYAIASYADGQVLLFLPYTKLKDMLKEDFKKRMNLH